MRERDVRAWLFDLDGTLYYGGEAAPGAKALLDYLRVSGKPATFVTNNSRHSSADIMKRLDGMGLSVPRDSIITATEYTGRYLLERYGRLQLCVCGSKPFEEAHLKAGHAVCPLEEEADIDAVVVGLDDAFTYRKLERIVQAVCNGARLIAANADLRHPGTGGRVVPETGALVAAIEQASGRKAEYVGKPNPYLFRCALEACAVSPEYAVMVGDNYDTDILGGKQAGLNTVWLSGLSAPLEESDAVLAMQRPLADLIVPNLIELYCQMGGNPHER
ncbi:HAD-IIA family hydrolase [Cohnella sp. AR92]|uniref:HAD-IIA family hydrolase n=1 Tax=Cohnella sp. AR92 TaxID=648716 RepID=UPI0013155873|nr:HAD-IIA family hydrolase [Cohnella sp. AR92]